MLMVGENNLFRYCINAISDPKVRAPEKTASPPYANTITGPIATNRVVIFLLEELRIAFFVYNFMISVCILFNLLNSN
jgi:hypothetical protein